MAEITYQYCIFWWLACERNGEGEVVAYRRGLTRRHARGRLLVSWVTDHASLSS